MLADFVYWHHGGLLGQHFLILQNRCACLNHGHRFPSAHRLWLFGLEMHTSRVRYGHWWGQIVILLMPLSVIDIDRVGLLWDLLVAKVVRRFILVGSCRVDFLLLQDRNSKVVFEVVSRFNRARLVVLRWLLLACLAHLLLLNQLAEQRVRRCHL